MKRFGTLLVAALGAVFLASNNATPAEVLIGVPAPFTGPNAWYGEEVESGVELAVAQLQAAGGVLHQKVRIIKVDDFCDGAQAIAAANKLVAEKVDFVMGHMCSGAAIPASASYAEVGILMMSPTATNPLLTEQGFSNVFRVCGRDDQQGTAAGRYLAEHWADKNIAILHDGQAYGQLGGRGQEDAERAWPERGDVRNDHARSRRLLRRS